MLNLLQILLLTIVLYFGMNLAIDIQSNSLNAETARLMQVEETTYSK